MKTHPQVLQKNTAQEVQGSRSPLYCIMVNKWRHHFYEAIDNLHLGYTDNTIPVEFDPFQRYFDGFKIQRQSIESVPKPILDTLRCDDQIVEGWNWIDPNGTHIIIFFDPTVAEVRQRFTIAHEWAHVLQTYDQQFRSDMEKIEDDGERLAIIESVANYTAVYYLTPSHLMYIATQGKCHTSQDYLGHVDSLANKFNISKQAMTYRINTAPLPNKQ